MSTAEGNIPMFMQAATYPIELFFDAVFLRDQAARDATQNPPDERGIPGPRQRAFARSAIFTAFNFLESLLIELSQERATTGPLKGTPVAQKILDDLRDGKAAISRTMKEWPVALVNVDVTGKHHFRHFKDIRGFRNQLIHAKLEPLNTSELTQDQLLRRANAAEATWVVGQVCLMATVLYQEFGKTVPPEIAAEAAKAPKHPPVRQ